MTDQERSRRHQRSTPAEAEAVAEGERAGRGAQRQADETVVRGSNKAK